MLQVMLKKVLIVEDNEFNMKFFNDLFEVYGYEILQIKDGFKVFEMVCEYIFDFIFMDI